VETNFIYDELMRIAAIARDENLVQVGQPQLLKRSLMPKCGTGSVKLYFIAS
jgi:hypothetical protein